MAGYVLKWFTCPRAVTRPTGPNVDYLLSLIIVMMMMMMMMMMMVMVMVIVMVLVW